MNDGPDAQAPAFPGLRHAMKKKQTRREKFLAKMEAVVLWMRLLALIERYYPEAPKFDSKTAKAFRPKLESWRFP